MPDWLPSLDTADKIGGTLGGIVAVASIAAYLWKMFWRRERSGSESLRPTSAGYSQQEPSSPPTSTAVQVTMREQPSTAGTALAAGSGGALGAAIGMNIQRTNEHVQGDVSSALQAAIASGDVATPTEIAADAAAASDALDALDGLIDTASNLSDKLNL